ncbi:hypothetical protein STEG23_004865 [Scotinomys teguina]
MRFVLSEVEYLRPLPRPPVRNRAEVHQFPYWKPLGSEVEHLRRHPRPPVPNSPGKINVGYCTDSSLFQKAVHHNPDGEPLGSEVEYLRPLPRPPVRNRAGSHQKTSKSKTPEEELEESNEMDVKSKRAVHHNPDGEPLGSEVEHLRRHPRPPVPNSPGKINVGYCTGSSLFQKAVHHNPDGEPLGSEVEHLLRPLPRPPVRNSPEVHHNPDGEPLGSEVEHLLRPLPRPPVRNSPDDYELECY